MKKTLKLLSLFLACMMLLFVFAACKDDNVNKQNGNQETGGNETQDNGDELYDANGYLKDSLPETYNFNSEFTIFTWDGQKSWEWLDTETDTMTVVEESLWTRELNVEDRFGVSIERVYASGDWDNRSKFITSLSQSVLGNDHLYDLVGQYTPAAGLGAVNGLYVDLTTNDYVDFEKPWWPTSIVETASVGDKLYFTTGDITPTLIRNVQCMFVNTSLYDSYQLKNEVDGRSIYQVVKDYDWTYETMLKMAQGKVSVSDTDTVEERLYGLAFSNSVAADSFFYAAGFTYVKNVDGIMSLSPDLATQTISDYFDKVKELFTGRYDDIAIAATAAGNPFTQQRALFYAGNVSESQTFSTENVKFSLLPMPMYVDGQQDYYTCANLWVTMYSIPVDAADMAMSGVILEALASEAYRTVSDEIYYNLFQLRYNGENQDSADMFDIVSDSVVFDSARYFSDALGLFAQFRTGVNDSAGNWTTIYDGNKGTWETKITNLYGQLG